MKHLGDILTKTAKSLEASTHPRVSVAWQDLDLVYRRVHNQLDATGINIIGKRLEDVSPDKAEVTRLNAIKKRVIKTKKPYHEELTIELNGGKRMFEMDIEPVIGEGGKVTGLMTVTIDVTDLVEARTRLAEANERLTKLVAEMID